MARETVSGLFSWQRRLGVQPPERQAAPPTPGRQPAFGAIAADQGKERLAPGSDQAQRLLTTRQGPLPEQTPSNAEIELVKVEHQQRPPADENGMATELQGQTAEADAIAQGKTAIVSAFTHLKTSPEPAQDGGGDGDRLVAFGTPELLEAPEACERMGSAVAAAARGWIGQSAALVACLPFERTQILAIGTGHRGFRTGASAWQKPNQRCRQDGATGADSTKAMQQDRPDDSPGERQRPDSREALLIDAHMALLAEAAASLEACSSWTLETPMVLLDPRGGSEGRILPIGQLGQWLDHLPPALDGFVRLRQGGMGLDEAYDRSRQEGGADFSEAWERAQQGVALVCHDDLVRFASLSQRGYGRQPKELLVVVRWPDQVSAFLLSCQRERRPKP